MANFPFFLFFFCLFDKFEFFKRTILKDTAHVTLCSSAFYLNVGSLHLMVLVIPVVLCKEKKKEEIAKI